MKKGVLILSFGALCLFVLPLFAQAPASIPVVNPVSSGLFSFLKANVSVIALAVYAILDIVILAVPSLAGNGLVHQLFLFAAKLSGQNPPASS